MPELFLTVISIALIGLIVWRELEHAKQLKELIFLIKSQQPEDYDAWKATETKTAPAEEERYEQIEAQDLTQQEVKNMTYGG